MQTEKRKVTETRRCGRTPLDTGTRYSQKAFTPELPPYVVRQPLRG